jgi:hypothetical protein
MARKREVPLDYQGPVSVIKLMLDTSDPSVLKRLETTFEAAFQLERALQRSVARKLEVYWTSARRRRLDRQTWRDELGLTKGAVTSLAGELLRESKWMRDHITTAHAAEIGMRVWKTLERHLFKGAGAPRVGRFSDFASVPGRGKSATKEREWESTRLFGTFHGHRDAFPSRQEESAFTQPHAMPVPARPGRTWWEHEGPLVVVIGNGKREGVFPVRLPSGLRAQPHLEHFLLDPSAWDKVTLVRVQDSRAPGGWGYWAHLTVQRGSYTSPSMLAARALAPQDRRAVVDGNVSVLAIASVPTDLSAPGADLSWEERRLTKEQKKAAAAAHTRKVKLSRKLAVQRRKSNTEQYELSKAQQAREERRVAKGLDPREVQVKKGPRVSNKAGVPKQAYRNDILTPQYRTLRGELAFAQRRASQDKDRQARELAREVVLEFGPHFSTEAVSWGKGVNAFTPGRLLAALKAECLASGGTYERFPTRTTALSQTCLCGHREKKPLSQRTHKCPACGFTWGRDLTSALVGLTVRSATDADGVTSHFVDESALTELRDFVEKTHRTTNGSTDGASTTGQQNALGRSSAGGPTWSSTCSDGTEPLPVEDSSPPLTPDEPKENGAATHPDPACHAGAGGSVAVMPGDLARSGAGRSQTGSNESAPRRPLTELVASGCQCPG